MRLHGVMQEIADIIGRDAALYLVGKLPRCHPASRKTETVILYVPTVKRLTPDHNLVRILGFKTAERLCKHFGGEILQPGNCRDVYRPFRDRSIARMVQEGIPPKLVAEWFEVSDRHVRNVMREILQEDFSPANDNNTASKPTKKTRAYNGLEHV